MNSKINNRLLSFRARLTCLDLPAHTGVWLNKPPLIFTDKVAQARAATETLAADAARQSAPTTGTTADKLREERELEDAAFALAQAVVTWATDHHDLTLAHKYDHTLQAWRRLRDETLLQRARLLHADATTLLTANGGADVAEAAKYGLDSNALASLKKETDDYAVWIATPRETIAGRTVLTASLPQQTRALTALFAQLEALLPQFATTPGGPAFAQAFRGSGLVIPHGHRYEPESGTLPATTTPPTP